VTALSHAKWRGWGPCFGTIPPETASCGCGVCPLEPDSGDGVGTAEPDAVDAVLEAVEAVDADMLPLE
jgi:hypothetical protein